MSDPGSEDDVDWLMGREQASFTPDPRTMPPDSRAVSSAPIGIEVVNWRRLSPERAPAAWDALREWVEWFVIRYRIPESTVPNCWWKHGHLVEELSALHAAHVVSFDTRDTGLGPITWHERLAAAMPRLTRAYAGGCSNGHKDIIPRSTIDEIDPQEWDAWTSQARAHRDAPASQNRKEEQ